MSMDLGKKTFSTEREYFIAGANIRITAAVKTAAAAITAHAPVELDANGKVKPLTAPSGSGTLDTSKLYGIAVEDTANGSEAVIYLTGEFFADGLTLPTGITAADIEVAFRNIGIFLK